MLRFFLALLITAACLSAQFRIESSGLSVELNPTAGYGLDHLRDAETARDYIAPGAKLPLYRLILSHADGSTVEVTSAGAASVNARRTSESAATLVFQHPDQGLTVICNVSADVSPRLAWKIAIRNEGTLGLRSLFYPQWTAPLQLPKGESRLLFPFLDGQEFIDPGKYLAEGSTKRIQYPGPAALQLLAYHDAEAGLLCMTLDGNGWVKHLRVARITGALDLSFEHNPDERPSTNIDLPYETILQPFRGGWQEAAGIYRQWALRQKWARKKLAERDLPLFLKKPLPIVTFEIRGDAYSAEWSMYFPPSNRLVNPEYHPSKIPELMERYSRFFGSRVISQPFAWEHIAPWIAGEYFPPIGGEQLWARTSAALRRAGDPLFLMLSGARWGVNMDNVGYDTREHFLKEIAPMAAAYDPSGKPVEEQPPWAISMALCVGTKFTQDHIAESFKGCLKRGASLVQYDQNHGGAATVCYRQGHGHPPGYGRWMVEETERVFQRIQSESKRLNPNFVFAVEEPCEYFIPYWELYMGRPYAFFGTGYDPTTHRKGVPVFIYVYHDFLLGYGGSNEIDISHPYAEAIKVARKFVNGTMLEIDPGKPAFRLDAEPSPTEELRLARSCLKALQTYANTYLVAGSMLREPEVRDEKKVRVRMWRDNTIRERFENMQSVEIPLVLCSAWTAGGKVAYTFANWQTEAQTLTFTPRQYLGQGATHRLVLYSDGATRTVQRSGSLPRELRIEVPALSALMVEQSEP
jgi:hypothetical protein